MIDVFTPGRIVGSYWIYRTKRSRLNYKLEKSKSFRNILSYVSHATSYIIRQIIVSTDYGYGDIVFLQVDFNTLGIKDVYKVILSLLLGMIKHSQSTQSNMFAISLQSLKERRQEGSSCFACRWTSKFLQLGIIVFDGSGQIHPKYPKQKVGNIFAKSVAAFLCSIVMQNIQIFYGGPAMFIVTCFLTQPD